MDMPVVYRVEVVHSDANHTHGTPTHYGPAVDPGYLSMLTFALGREVNAPDEARKIADACRAAHPDEEGFTTRIVTLDNDEWVEVS